MRPLPLARALAGDSTVCATSLTDLSPPPRARGTSIIEPLASRCSKFRFRALDVGSTEERLRFIADKEGVARDDGVRPPSPPSPILALPD